MKFLVIGCGLSGCTAARLLKDKGHEVKIYESRSHIAGNCYDSKIGDTMVHNYGPHIFHTDDEEVFSFLSRFTEWIPFEYRPVGVTPLGNIPLPYHDNGSEKHIGKVLSDDEIRENIFRDYSEKQWGVSFDDIPKTITNRIPKTRGCDNPTWFEGQKYQCLPKGGYTRMFENMIEGIEVKLNCDKDEWKDEEYDYLIYTGKIDEYFGYRYGELEYRSLDLKHEESEKKMDTLVYNQCNKGVEYTRIYDHSYFDPNHRGNTVITKEYPKKMEKGDIPFYPIPWGEGQKKYSQYRKLVKEEKNTVFLGRLARYKYMDMWMCIKDSMNKINNMV